MSGEKLYYDRYEKDSVGGGQGILIDLFLMFMIWAMIQLISDLAWILNVKGAKVDAKNYKINVMHAILLPVLSLYQMLTAVDYECTKA